MSLLWMATGSKGAASLQGNTDVEWYKIQTIRPESIGVVDNPDPLRGPEKMFQFEVRYGDNYPGMSDCRCLLTGPAKLWTDRGTEQWWRWWTLQPQDWIGLYPKWDQQSDWPRVGSIAGSGLEFHHEPFGGGVESGSAPLYTGANDGSLWLGLVDPATNTYRNRFDLVPLERCHWYEWILHVLWDWDPSKGFLELWIDGAKVLPKLQTSTMFPNTRIYPVAGIYRNFNIGGQVDQNGNPLVWTVSAKPGTSYPHGFVPNPGQLVYPDSGGYPGVQCLGGFAVGSTREDVMNAYRVKGGSVPSPPIGLPPKAQEGLELLIAQRPSSTRRSQRWTMPSRSSRRRAMRWRNSARARSPCSTKARGIRACNAGRWRALALGSAYVSEPPSRQRPRKARSRRARSIAFLLDARLDD